MIATFKYPHYNKSESQCEAEVETDWHQWGGGDAVQEGWEGSMEHWWGGGGRGKFTGAHFTLVLWLTTEDENVWNAWVATQERERSQRGP